MAGKIKKLYLSDDDRKLFGVRGGIAEYLKWTRRSYTCSGDSEEAALKHVNRLLE